MSNSRDAENLFALTSSLAKLVEDNEQLSFPMFAVKLANAQNSYPEDHTIGMMSRVIDKMANNSNKLFISRAEVKDLYEKFYSRNNKFASVFAEELGQVEVAPVAVVAPVSADMNDMVRETIDSMVDPVLASALDKAFGGNTVKGYNSSTAKRVVAACNSKLQSLGFAINTSILCADRDIFVCAVAFETPRGTTSVLVPVETDTEHAYEPAVFVGNNGSAELSSENVVSYVTSQAGNKLSINAQEILQAVLLAKGSNNEVSDVELALTKLNATKEQAAYVGNQVLGVQVETVNPNLILDVPQINDPEIQAIAKTFDSELGFANFTFGNKIINSGKEVIARQLGLCDVNNHTIAVNSSNDNSIIYSVALNGGVVAFTVPVKIEGDKVFPPSILLCNGSVQSFDKASISGLLRANGFDRMAAISASPLYGIKASELVNIVKSAIAEENYIKAEDALNILSEGDDEKAYDIALNAFTQGLQLKKAEVEEVSKCSMVVQSNHSQYDLCGHTGLPLHKVYQDKHGNCQAGYRKGMADSYEGATFMDSKVFF